MQTEQLIHTTGDTTLGKEVTVITVEMLCDGSSIQTMWEHETIRDVCSWEELGDEGRGGHEGKQLSQREPKKRNRRRGGGYKIVYQ